MTIRVGINGFGTMGRYFLRALFEEIDGLDLVDGNRIERVDDEIEVVAVNDLYPAAQLAPFLRDDSTYHRFPRSVKVDGSDLIIGGRRVLCSTERKPSSLPWGGQVDVIYESTGAWVKKPKDDNARAKLESYLMGMAGAQGILFSAPVDFGAELEAAYNVRTIVPGVNSEECAAGGKLVSLGSCTTNCLAPVAKAMLNAFGEYVATMTTVHAYTVDQRLVDSPHPDVARGYAAALNFVPTTTGAAKAIGKVIAELDKRIDGIAIRGPVAAGSALVLTAELDGQFRDVDINEAMRRQAKGDGVLEYREGPVTTAMIVGYPVPSVFDAKQTRAVYNPRKNTTLAMVVSWYDNVAGFSHQALDGIALIGCKNT